MHILCTTNNQTRFNFINLLASELIGAHRQRGWNEIHIFGELKATVVSILKILETLAENDNLGRAIANIAMSITFTTKDTLLMYI